MSFRRFLMGILLFISILSPTRITAQEYLNLESEDGRLPSLRISLPSSERVERAARKIIRSRDLASPLYAGVSFQSLSRRLSLDYRLTLSYIPEAPAPIPHNISATPPQSNSLNLCWLFSELEREEGPFYHIEGYGEVDMGEGKLWQLTIRSDIFFSPSTEVSNFSRAIGG